MALEELPASRRWLPAHLWPPPTVHTRSCSHSAHASCSPPPRRPALRSAATRVVPTASTCACLWRWCTRSPTTPRSPPGAPRRACWPTTTASWWWWCVHALFLCGIESSYPRGAAGGTSLLFVWPVGSAKFVGLGVRSLCPGPQCVQRGGAARLPGLRQRAGALMGRRALCRRTPAWNRRRLPTEDPTASTAVRLPAEPPGAQINSYLHLNGQNRLRQRTYSVGHHVRYGFRFEPIVRHPSQSRCVGGGAPAGCAQGPSRLAQGPVVWGLRAGAAGQSTACPLQLQRCPALPLPRLRPCRSARGAVRAGGEGSGSAPRPSPAQEAVTS